MDYINDKNNILLKIQYLNPALNQLLNSISDTLNNDRTGSDETPFLEFIHDILKNVILSVLKVNTSINQKTIQVTLND